MCKTLQSPHVSGRLASRLLLVLCLSAALPGLSLAVVEAVGPGVAGQIHALTYDTDDANRIYVGGDVCGVYRTDDHGLNWYPWSEGMENPDRGRGYVDDLLVIRDSDIPPAQRGVYAATWTGIYFRADGATSWQLMTPRDRFSYRAEWQVSGANHGMPIPFSCLAYDSTSHVLFAGAGNGRWLRANEHSRLMYPAIDDTFNYAPVANTEPGQFSLYMIHLSEGGATWEPIPETANHGLVRQIAITNYDNETYVVFASSSSAYNCIHGGIFYNTLTGIQGQSVWPPLQYHDKNMVPVGLTLPDHYWGVAFGSDNTLYALFSRETETDLQPGILSMDLDENGFGDWNWLGDDVTDVPPYSAPFPYPHRTWHDIVLNTGETFTSIAIRKNISNFDEIYVGQRKSYGSADSLRYLSGGFYTNRKNLTTKEFEGWQNRIFIIPGTGWNDFTYHYLTSPTTDEDLDVGWLNNYEIPPTVPMAFSPVDEEHMAAFMYHIPLVSDDGGVHWHQVYCNGSMHHWSSRGMNLMAAQDLTFTEDGRLIIADNNFGLHVGSDAANSSFRWLSRYNDGELAKMYPDVEVSDGRIFVARSAPTEANVNTDCREGLNQLHNGRYVICERLDPDESDCYDCTMSIDLDAELDAEYDDCPYWVWDIEFVDANTLFAVATVGGDTSVCLKGVYAEETWDWSIWDRKTEGGRYCCIERLPGTNKLLIGVKQSSERKYGGLYCVDIYDSGLGDWWLRDDDEGGTDLSLCSRSVHCIATDRTGAVLYVGTAGGNHWQEDPGDITTGTVLRLYGPFDGSVPNREDWAILANVGSTPQLAPQPCYYQTSQEPGLWYWGNENSRRVTEVHALAVDRRNPNVVYAGLNCMLYMTMPHPANGVYRYNNGDWEKILGDEALITGGDPAPDRGVTSLAIDPNDETSMYVAASGEEVFRFDLPEVEGSYPTVAPVARYPLMRAEDMPSIIAIDARHWDGSLLYLEVDASSISSDPGAAQLILNDEGEDQDVAAEDGVYTSPQFQVAAIENGSHTLRYFARGQDGICGYGTFNVLVIDQPAAKYDNKSSETGNLQSLEGEPYSSITLDYDNDSDPDLLVSVKNESPGLFMRTTIINGVPWFDNSTLNAFLDSPPNDLRGLASADYDNDGDFDFFACHGDSAKLYANNAGIFQDVTSEVLAPEVLNELADSWTASWGDYNNDGWVDLIVGFDSSDKCDPDPTDPPGKAGHGLLLKNESGQFVDATAEAGINTEDASRTFTAIWGDVNDDNMLDLFIGNLWSTSSHLYINNGPDAQTGDYTFTDETESWFDGVDQPIRVEAASWCDVNQDGRLDLAVARHKVVQGDNILIYMNSGGAPFLQYPIPGSGIYQIRCNLIGLGVYDYDNNGYEDLLLLPEVESAPPPLFAYFPYDVGNELVFGDMSAQVDLGSGKSNGATISDFDFDGLLDVYLGRTAADTTFYLKSTPFGQGGQVGDWVALDLHGDGLNNNCAAIGVRVEIEVDGHTQVRVVDGGSGRGGQAAHMLHFGLGDYAGETVPATILWTNGVMSADTLAVNAVNVVNDPTMPEILIDSVESELHPGPSGNDWIFTWQTVYCCDPDSDKVYLYSNYEPGETCYCDWSDVLGYGNPHVLIEVSALPEGGYEHTVTWGKGCCIVNRPACDYRYRVESGTGFHTQKPDSMYHFQSVQVCTEADEDIEEGF